MQLACFGASAGDTYVEDVVSMNEDSTLVGTLPDARKVSLVEEGEVAGVGCDGALKLAKECATTLRRSHMFLKKMQLEAVELDTVLNKAKNAADAKKQQPKKEAMLGEIRDMSHRIGESISAAEPSYCIDTRVMLKKCHDHLFKVTAFIERVSANGGQPRAGMPGSVAPSIPKPTKSKIVKGSTNAPIYKNVTMSKVEIKEAEDICKNLAKTEVLADKTAYKKKDTAGSDSEFKEETNTQISMFLQQRVNFFASERKNKKIATAIPEPEKLPKCQGCWYRRRRAGRQGEINSCPDLPPKAKMPKPKPAKKKIKEEEPTETPVPKMPKELKPVKDEKTTANKTEAPKPASAPKSNSTEIVTNELAGYTTPLAGQGKFFYGGLVYQGKGAWSCSVKGGAETSCSGPDGNLPCELKGPKKDLSECQKRCDKCAKCIGFNYVRNPVTAKEGNGNGGICVFFNKDPVKAKVPAKKCGPFSDKYKKTLCKSPMKDKDYYCCSEAVLFIKKSVPKVQCLACCNAARAADRCDGPQCENCTPNKAPLGSCKAAKKCCQSTPPCDDRTCLDCPTPRNDGYAQKLKGKDGVSYKYNIPQPSMTPPWKLDNYNSPDRYQKKFYLGALKYEGAGAYSCNNGFAANVKSPTKCTALPKASKLADCKAYCDNKKDCWGFNIIFNAYNKKYMGNSANDGGMCVFLKDDPLRSKVDSVSCAGWQGKKALCVNPGSDRNHYCCSEGYFYKKKQPAAVCTAVEEGVKDEKGNPKEATCVFPFKHKGKSYNKCITADSKSGAAWCTVNAATGSWGYCDMQTCRKAGVAIEAPVPGSMAAKAVIAKAKEKMAKALAPKSVEAEFLA